VRAIRRRARQWLLLTHVICSLGWMGAGATNLVLAITALRSGDAVLRSSCYQLINIIDFSLVIPLAFSALASGVIISLATKWRLLRHWWVLVKLLLTVAVIVFSTVGVGVWVEQSMAATTSSAPTSSPVALDLVVGAGANIAAFLFMTWASITKPWPKTPWTTAVRHKIAT
jgi:uncharacterized membrane protein